ncbi:CDT1-like protein b [Vicia villosa]|uniref:CDT1-like protein b n=1 Tax=Vicia villosa TaxID=3911 RepID=UPI00273CEB60|nr:CDT1-like protein b [Vicia villosa]XP_058739373.1 CDT1-like protein b [Vicia villosa]
MDPKVCDESVKEASDFKPENILQPVDESIVCPTPQKKTELLPNKFKDPIAQLPENYRVIADLFRHMSCSLRLLHLRKKSPTFLNICNKVEVLAKRNFSHADLAQMKYILPEGIEIEKVVVIDKKSLCMKPDLKITLVFEVVKDHSEQSADIALRQYFNSRLINFFNLHPQVTKIPESRLPEPFSQETCNLTFNIGRADIAAEPSSTSNEIVEPLKNLHLTNLAAELSSTSNEIIEPLKNLHLNAADQAKQVHSFSSSENSLSSDESDSLYDQESESSWQKECTPMSDCERNLNAESGKQKELLSMSFQANVVNTPSEHKTSSPRSVSRCISESPDLKIVSCADSLLTQTPALSAPERLVLGSDVKPQKMSAQKSMSCFKPAKRALDFTQTEGNCDLDDRVDMLESSKTMHEFDCSSKLSKGRPEDCKSFDSVSLPREVQENLCYSFEKISQNQVSSDASDDNPPSLVELVNVIDSIFTSVKTNAITKEELLQKIMPNCLDFVDTREAEEQIEILEKIVPDWICKKSLASVDGVTMYCVNNAIDLDSVRSRLLSNVTKGDE